MSDSGHESGGHLSQSSIEDDEVVWRGSALNDSDFIILRHPLLEAHSLPSTISGKRSSDGDLSSVLDRFSLCDQAPSTESESSDIFCGDGTNRGRGSRTPSSDASTASSEYHSGACTPTASYDDASAFISRYLSSPVGGGDAQRLDLLRALIVELGVRLPSASDLPCTISSAKKLLKSEAHINIKEYIMTRHQGQLALRGILKPSKSALRKDIRKGNKVSREWAKQHGLQVLLITCFT